MAEKKPKTAAAPEHSRSIITCQIQKKPDGSLQLISVDPLPELERGNLLYIDLPAAGCEAPWKKDMLRAEAAMQAQEDRKRQAAGLPPLRGATPEATDKALSKQVDALSRQVATLTALLTAQAQTGTARPADSTVDNGQNAPAEVEEPTES